MKNKIKKIFKVPVLISDEMSCSIDLWKRAYKNSQSLSDDANVKSMNLCSAIAAEVARLVTIEFRSDITGSGKADFINESYQEFLKSLRRYTEYAAALGGVIFKPYLKDGRLSIECIGQDRFYPIEFSDSKLVSCVFAEQKKSGGKHYLRLEYHKMTNGGVEIINKAFMQGGILSSFTEVPLNRVEGWEEICEYTFFEGIDKPLFSYFKIPFANNIDIHSPLGVAVFSRALDVISEADKQYSRLLWEFEGGELAVDASVDALKHNGKGYQLPKLNERLFRGIDIELSSGDLYSVFSPTLRDESLINGLETLLVRIEDLCGLSRGVFSKADISAKTATEIKIMRQKTYSTVTDIQNSLENALLSLVDALSVLCDIYGLAPSGDIKTSFEFDDSIVCDREAEFKERLELLKLGVIEPWEMRVWYLGEPEEQAKVV